MACDQPSAVPPQVGSPEALESIEFRVPAYGQMPPSQVVLSTKPGDPWASQPQQLRTKAANVAYLAVRDCPAAIIQLQRDGLLSIPLSLSPKAVLLDESSAKDLTTLPESEALACVRQKVEAHRWEGAPTQTLWALAHIKL